MYLYPLAIALCISMFLVGLSLLAVMTEEET